MSSTATSARRRRLRALSADSSAAVLPVGGLAFFPTLATTRQQLTPDKVESLGENLASTMTVAQQHQRFRTDNEWNSHYDAFWAAFEEELTTRLEPNACFFLAFVCGVAAGPDTTLIVDTTREFLIEYKDASDKTHKVQCALHSRFSSERGNTVEMRLRTNQCQEFETLKGLRSADRFGAKDSLVLFFEKQLVSQPKDGLFAIHGDLTEQQQTALSKACEFTKELKIWGDLSTHTGNALWRCLTGLRKLDLRECLQLPWDWHVQENQDAFVNAMKKLEYLDFVIESLTYKKQGVYVTEGVNIEKVREKITLKILETARDLKTLHLADDLENFAIDLADLENFDMDPGMKEEWVRTCVSRFMQRIAALEKLDRLELPYALPEKIGSLHNYQALRVLDLSASSSLLTLSEQITSVTTLQEIHLADCGSLEKLPNSMANLTDLRTLDLENCKVLQGPLPSGIHGLKRLNLANCLKLELWLTATAAAVKELSSLEHLDLSCLGYLARQLFYLGDNYPPEESPGFGGKLKSLNVSKMSLGVDPGCLRGICTRCTALQELNLTEDRNKTGGNGIRTLPAEIAALTALEKLYLRHCRELEAVPDSVAQIKRLKELDLRGCHALRTLPPLEQCHSP